MEITKTTKKYSFYKEGADYILDLGNIKRAEDRTTELLFTGVEDSNFLTLHPSCTCTATTERTIIDQNSLSIKLNYKNCDPTFAKTVVIKYKDVKIGLIKLRGRCNQE